MKTLPPQILKPSDYESVAKQIILFFKINIFQPVYDIAFEYNSQIKEIKNAEDTPLILALRSGMVQYRAGTFTGSFSRAISANLRHLGAQFDKRTGTYKLSDKDVPSGVKSEAITYESKARMSHDLIISKLNEMQVNLDKTFETFEIDGTETLFKVKDGFEKTAKNLEVMPTLTPDSWKVLAEEYTENMKLFIRKFAEQEISDLRETTKENAMIGYRFDKLASYIENKYKTSAAKAEFLARTETSIFMSKFREREFSEIGVTRYIWRTSGDSRVRDDHKALNGKIFFYSQPPVADIATGTRANPGAIWRCRCIDEPILEPVKVGS